MLSAESYYQVLSGVTDPLYPTQVFTPARNMSNIEYNYMVVVDQQDNESIYDVGDIYAQQIDIAKNAYNSLYSMDISAASDGIPCANRCRDYRGVFTDGQYVYLKYYDNANYSQLSSRVNDGIVDQYMVKSKTSAYPFQKIETYIPNNFETRCKHKSNLFSINIRNKKIEDLKQFDDPECEKIYEQIHTEIKNAIRTIADNICPVNTQFFDVYFDK